MGGTPANEDEALKLHPEDEPDDAVVALVAAVSFLKKHPESTGKVGAVGFCFGGLMVNRLAASSKELDAGVAYYGRQVPADAGQEHHRAAAAALRGEGRRRERRHRGLRSRAQGQQEAYTLHMYPGTQHAFNNDTGAARYNKAAADLAWGRTLAFFKETLGVPPSAA